MYNNGRKIYMNKVLDIKTLIDRLSKNDYPNTEYIYTFNDDKYFEYIFDLAMVNLDNKINYRTLEEIKDLANYLTWLKFDKLETDINNIEHKLISVHNVYSYYLHFIKYIYKMNQSFNKEDFKQVYNSLINIHFLKDEESINMFNENLIGVLTVREWNNFYHHSLLYRFTCTNSFTTSFKNEKIFVNRLLEKSGEFKEVDTLCKFPTLNDFKDMDIKLYNYSKTSPYFDILYKETSLSFKIKKLVKLLINDSKYMLTSEMELIINIISKYLYDHDNLKDYDLFLFKRSLYYLDELYNWSNNYFYYWESDRVIKELSNYLMSIIENKKLNFTLSKFKKYILYIDTISIENITELKESLHN